MAELDAIGKWQMKMQTKELGISPTGEAELYHIGQRLRKKVSGLLHSQFNPHEIEVRCTDTDRSKRSALSFLQGIYEHSGEIKTYDKKSEPCKLTFQNIPRTADVNELSL